METEALLPPHSPPDWNLPYLNLVAAGKTELDPLALIQVLKEIEAQMGRDMGAPRWSPRVIDLDILAWGDQVIDHEKVKVPHPELFNRPFFVQLMATLQGSWRTPHSGTPYSNLTLDEIIHRNPDYKSCAGKWLVPSPQLVGIVNVTPDSFSDGGLYHQAEKSIQRIHELIKQGAAVIDIGAQSTRPGSSQIGPEGEWNRLEPVLKLVARDFHGCRAKPVISLDTYYAEVVRKACQVYPLDWINDVKAGADEGVLEVAAEWGCKIILNHSLTVPPSEHEVLSFNESPLVAMTEWAHRQIERLKRYGIGKERIILDPGISFGKTVCQNLTLLREIGTWKSLGCPLLVGHSRKSFLKFMTNKEPRKRDLETIGISHHLMNEGVDYLRVHDVEAHQRALTAYALLKGQHVT